MDIISIANLINAQDCFANVNFHASWKEHYVGEVFSCLGESPDASKVRELGDHLSEIFSRTRAGRQQSDVSVSGNLWSRLVTWYLNLTLYGTRAWAVSSSELIPSKVRDAIHIEIGGEPIQNSKETIILAYTGAADVPLISVPTDPQALSLRAAYLTSYKDFVEQIPLQDLRVILVSIKTSGSDLLAIPLFWNFCYKGNCLGADFDVRCGINGSKPEDFYDNKLLYSLVIVPSGQRAKIDSGAIPGRAQLAKLSLLDGGLYWGRPSSHVSGLSSFFQNNLSGFGEGGRLVSEEFGSIGREGAFTNRLFTGYC